VSLTSKDQRLYLIHIVEALGKIHRYTKGGKAAFFSDEMVQDAVYRKFLVIGEATKRLSAEVWTMDEAIPWKAMVGTRDVMVHRYQGIQPDLVWQVIEDVLGGLEQRLLALLDKLGGVEWPQSTENQ
jgi:uncharacterized protein with HEPN domain